MVYYLLFEDLREELPRHERFNLLVYWNNGFNQDYWRDDSLKGLAKSIKRSHRYFGGGPIKVELIPKEGLGELDPTTKRRLDEGDLETVRRFLN